jgi:hypothetical protein
MSEINKLSDSEKLFLAAAVRSIIVADGKIEDEELAKLSKMEADIEFKDFAAFLSKAEAQIKDEESFWALAKTISSEETRELAIDLLAYISFHSGLRTENEEKILEKLKAAWGYKE